MCCRCSIKAKRLWAFGISGLFCVIAIIIGIAWPLIAHKEIEKQFVLQPNTQIYEAWFDPPIDSFMELYLWNWTNAEDYQKDGYKPHLEQLGPYTFRERRERVGVEWNDDKTLTFFQKRIWHFDSEMSVGDYENDMVMTINPILVTIGFAMQGHQLLPFIDSLLLANPQMVNSPFYNVRVKDILFEGYDDILLKSLLELAEENPALIDDLGFPAIDKFGWFYGRNESETYDGNFTIGTGVDTFENMGLLRLWNGANRTDFFRDECGEVSGSLGELWPPFQEKSASNVSIFSPDICSTMTLEFDGDFSMHGIDGYKWKGNERVFDNGHRYSETKCQCTAPEEECPVLPAGVLDVSRCQLGAPATISYPHFYLADETYRDTIDGMKPNKSEHEFMLALEPYSGIPLTVRAQLQVNVQVRQYGLTLLKDIPEMMLPILWFRQRAELSQEFASDLKLLLILPNIGIYTAIGFGIVGLVWFAFALYFNFRVWKK